MNIRKTIAGAVTALLVGGGLAVATSLPASAHTPEVSSTCQSITVDLTNYEYIAGTPAQTGTRVVTPAVPFQPAVYGERPLITPAVEYVPANPGVTQYQYSQLVTGKTKWLDSLTWNPGLGWYYNGTTQVVGATPEVPAQEAVYGEAPLISAEVAAQPEVTEQYEVAPATPARDNGVTILVDGVIVHEARFGTSYSYTQPIDGVKGHTYNVVIDAIGSAYDKTINGKTTACKPTDITVPALNVVPPTCDTDGTLPFLNNPAAQNPNGYEFPGQGFRVYISPAFSGPGTYTATIQKVGPGFDPAFPYGTKIVGGDTAQELVVEAATGYQGTDPEAPCYVAVPPTETTFGTWTTPVIDCDTQVGDELAISRENTVVTYSLNTATGEVTSSTETVTERDVHIVTQDEVDAVECPLPPATPEEPTTPVAQVEDVVPMGGDEGTLAVTGSSLSPVVWGSGVLALVLGAGLAVWGAVRRRQAA